MPSVCLKLSDGRHVIPTITIQDDGKGYEIHHVRVEDGRVDDVLKVKLGGPETILVSPNVNEFETELIGDDGVLTIAGYLATP